VNVARSLTARNLFDDLHVRLGLHWVAGTGEGVQYSVSAGDLSARPDLAGFLNLIHPNKVQVLGETEIRYLDSLESTDLAITLRRILKSNPISIVIGDGLDVPPSIISASAGSGTALMRTDTPAWQLANYLQYHIARTLARPITLHGVFMEVFTIGVQITGDPGSGKSELALELLNRGHRLIADDAPEFTQISPDIIEGTCPEALQDCLEVRGLGVLNVRQMFGDATIKLNKFLRLIIHLEIPGDASKHEFKDRLSGDISTQKVLELEVPRITLPVLAGRNMAVMAEAAVRDFMLKMKGYDATSAFIERHSRILKRNQRDLEN
jgi:HPr kinase/phosphorylase